MALVPRAFITAPGVLSSTHPSSWVSSALAASVLGPVCIAVVGFAVELTAHQFRECWPQSTPPLSWVSSALAESVAGPVCIAVIGFALELTTSARHRPSQAGELALVPGARRLSLPLLLLQRVPALTPLAGNVGRCPALRSLPAFVSLPLATTTGLPLQALMELEGFASCSSMTWVSVLIRVEQRCVSMQDNS